jgi:hypothetical protein
LKNSPELGSSFFFPHPSWFTHDITSFYSSHITLNIINRYSVKVDCCSFPLNSVLGNQIDNNKLCGINTDIQFCIADMNVCFAVPKQKICQKYLALGVSTRVDMIGMEGLW